MKKFKYMLVRIKNIQWKKLFKIAKKVSKITNKPQFIIAFDILICGIKYGAGYMDYFEFEFYALKGKERKTFLTSTINNQIIAKYNNKVYMSYFSDKIIFNQTFQKYLGREFLDIRNCSEKEFKEFLKNKNKIIAKPLNGCGGKGITIYNTNEIKKEELKEKKQYLLEELIIQNKQMNRLYSKSINSLRIISFLTDKKEVIILKRVLRIGNSGSVDNFSSGGMYTFLDEKGKVLIPAIDELGNTYEIHPISKTKIVGFQIPNYKEIENLIKYSALEIPAIRYVGWDVAISEVGPVLIEGNEYSGIFQMKPSLSKIKIGDYPLYKKYMDI